MLMQEHFAQDTAIPLKQTALFSQSALGGYSIPFPPQVTSTHIPRFLLPNVCVECGKEAALRVHSCALTVSLPQRNGG